MAELQDKAVTNNEKKYVKPELEITEFEVEDVITTSGNNPTDVIDGDEDADEGDGY